MLMASAKSFAGWCRSAGSVGKRKLPTQEQTPPAQHLPRNHRCHAQSPRENCVCLQAHNYSANAKAPWEASALGSHSGHMDTTNLSVYRALWV
jgi:hypothetical protein